MTTALIILGVLIGIFVIIIIVSQKKGTRLPEYENPPPIPEKALPFPDEQIQNTAEALRSFGATAEQAKRNIEALRETPIRNAKGQFVKGKDALAFLERDSVTGKFKKKS